MTFDNVDILSNNETQRDTTRQLQERVHAEPMLCMNT